MIFRPELAAKVMAGEKTVTRRLVSDNPRSPWWRERCAFPPGKLFAVCPGRSKPNIGHGRVVSLRKERLGDIINGALSHVEARREGFEDFYAFRDGWEKINGRWDGSALVWRVEFERV